MVRIKRYAPDGAHTEQEFDGAITVGRATDNNLQLPGLLVALHHLRLTPSGELLLALECLSTVGVGVNGLPGQRSAVLAPGDEVQVGGHTLRLGLADEGGLLLEVRERDPQSAELGDRATTSLEAAGWRMRRPALIAALLILAVCLVVPLLLRAVPAPGWLAAWLPSDQLWSSGRISNAHIHFGHDCGSCHERLFVRVRDQACLACHEGIAHHGETPESMAHAGLDERSCASCHFEHGGTHAVLTAHPALCTDCHASPDRFPALAAGAPVRDFARAHPPFRVAVVSREAPGALQRALLDERTRDHSGLIYPHDLHLDPKGVRGPEGVEVLQCADCHRPGPGDVGFEPLRFEPHCQRCHQLDVDVGGLPFRLPHADSDAVRTLLESAIGMAPLRPAETASESDRRRPGERAERGDGSSTPEMIDDVFARRVCAKCHEVDRPENEPLRVRAPDLRQTWMPMARFTHAPHQWVACEACHAASVSADSDDLLLPQIASCRDCHGGVGSTSSIQSTCIDCHRFHQAATLTMSKFMGELANGQTLESGQ
jgi:hypothetical protein